MKKKSTKQVSKQSDEHRVMETSDVLLSYIARVGWASEQDLIAFATEQDIDLKSLHQAVRVLDRQKLITARPGPDGKTQGWESMVGKGSGMRRYGALSKTHQAVMTLLTPTLGQISLDDTNFTLARDIDGNVIFTPAQCRAMLRKAYRLTGLAANPESSEAAISRIAVRFLGCTPKGPMVTVKRRPVTREGKAVGVLVHEALPVGSTIAWSFAFPTTHFNDEAILRLLAAAENVGFTPAGSGRAGGHHGLFAWTKPSRTAVREDSEGEASA